MLAFFCFFFFLTVLSCFLFGVFVSQVECYCRLFKTGIQIVLPPSFVVEINTFLQASESNEPYLCYNWKILV